jgi:hypothetical protein
LKTLLLLFLLIFPLSAKSAKSNYIIVEQNNKKGLVNEKGEQVIPAMYDDLGWSKGYPEVFNNVLGYKNGHLWGLINIKNQKIVDPVYAAIYPAGKKSIIASRFNQSGNEVSYGMIDVKGKTLVSFNYYTLDHHGDHLVASLKRDGLVYGIITTKERPLLPVRYQKVEHLQQNIFRVKDFDNKTAYFNAKTRIASPFVYDSIFNHNEHYLIIIQGGKYGIMHKDGRVLVSPEYKEVTINDDNTVKALPFIQWNIMNQKNEKSHSYSFDEIHPVGNNVMKVRVGKNEALIDLNGSQLSKLYHCNISTFNNDHAVISYMGKQGVISKNGNLVVPIEYDSIIIADQYFFSNKIQNQKPHWSILDLTGTALHGPEYHEVRQLNDELFAVKINQYWGLTSTKGEQITSCKFDSLVLQEDGNILARYFNQEGVLDKHGEWVIMPTNNKFTYISPNLYITSDPFCNTLVKRLGVDIYCSSGEIIKRRNDLLEIRQDGMLGLLSLNGDVYLKTRYDYISDLQNDSIYVFKKEGVYGIMAKNGKILTDGHRFEEVHSLNEEYLGMKLAGKYGFIDVNGKLRIANRYDSIARFSEGLAAIKLIGRWGFIDKQERLKVQPRYDEVQEFRNGLALVKRNGKYGLVNGDDRLVLPLDFDKLERIQSGRYISYKEGRYGLVGIDGRELVFPRYEEIQDLKNGFLLIQRRGKYGMGTLDGELIIPLIYEAIVYDSYNNIYLTAEQPDLKELRLP